MRFLILVFLLVALAAVLAGKWAAVALALVWAGLCLYASRVFDRQDQQWLRDPRNARLPADTRSLMLAESECECIWVPQELVNLQAAGQLANPNEDPR